MRLLKRVNAEIQPADKVVHALYSSSNCATLMHVWHALNLQIVDSRRQITDTAVNENFPTGGRRFVCVNLILGTHYCFECWCRMEIVLDCICTESFFHKMNIPDW